MKMQSKVAGTGESLVMMPGGLTGWLSWEPHAEWLAGSRKTVRMQLLSVQLGLEGKPLPPDYSIRFETKSLAATLDELDLGSPLDFAGWSMGAAVTLDYALERPEAVRSLVLIEPPAFWALDREDAEAQAAFDATADFTGDISEDQLERFLGLTGLLPPGQSAKDLPQWPLWSRHRQSLRGIPFVNRHTGSIEQLRRLTCPVLLVKGTGSASFLHRIIDSLAESLPNAEVAEWPAGHAPHIVSMEPFLERMSAFHERVSAAVAR